MHRCTVSFSAAASIGQNPGSIDHLEGSMGLLDGKKALIFGVANDHSIAWGIARALHDEGATLGFSSVESLIERRVRPLATSIGSTFVEACDVSSDEQLRAVLDKWKAEYGQVDVLVHAVAYSRARSPRRRGPGSRSPSTSPRTASWRCAARPSARASSTPGRRC
jgi:NAD(P)-dependent dehydrogenase (short-subunit alcohol dehydrogenase family)